MGQGWDGSSILLTRSTEQTNTTLNDIGADGGSRTHDLYFTKVLLYQLSYIGMVGVARFELAISRPLDVRLKPLGHTPINPLFNHIKCYYNNMQKYILYTDGGARGNPGPAAVGVVIYDAKLKEVDKFAHYLGVATNNQAEYQALILGLGRVQKIAKAEHQLSEVTIEVFMDSELIVRQMKGEYKVKNKELKPLFAKVEELSAKFASVKFNHVLRDKNTIADKLLNEELDKH